MRSEKDGIGLLAKLESMKKLWMVLALWGALAVQLHAQWKPVEGRISTQWSE